MVPHASRSWHLITVPIWVGTETGGAAATDGAGMCESDGAEVRRPELLIDVDISWPFASIQETAENIGRGWDANWPSVKSCPGRTVSNPKRAVRAMENGLPGMSCGVLIKPYTSRAPKVPRILSVKGIGDNGTFTEFSRVSSRTLNATAYPGFSWVENHQALFHSPMLIAALFRLALRARKW